MLRKKTVSAESEICFFREENLKGALDGSEDSGVKTQNEDEDKEPFDQSKIDFQLARALDLIRGISVFGSMKASL